ncbi:hypothetical protein A2U01_0012729 [Trifolium medium]|uniref:Uncharacterized protein n=1 Tax=Trifolium medium TaxID=97028 RepID=A0A392MXY0_9FABA|nr:hypothetical protein [Trifolium medium]
MASSPSLEPSSNLEVALSSESYRSDSLSPEEEISVIIETLKGTLQGEMDYVLSHYHEVENIHNNVEEFRRYYPEL